MRLTSDQVAIIEEQRMKKRTGCFLMRSFPMLLRIFIAVFIAVYYIPCIAGQVILFDGNMYSYQQVSIPPAGATVSLNISQYASQYGATDGHFKNTGNGGNDVHGSTQTWMSWNVSNHHTGHIASADH